ASRILRCSAVIAGAMEGASAAGDWAATRCGADAIAASGMRVGLARSVRRVMDLPFCCLGSFGCFTASLLLPILEGQYTSNVLLQRSTRLSAIACRYLHLFVNAQEMCDVLIH